MFAEALGGLEMTVTIGGEDFDAKFKPGDMIRFERHTGRGMSSLASTDKDGNPSVKLEDLAFLAFAALTRTDRFDGDFDARAITPSIPVAASSADSRPLRSMTCRSAAKAFSPSPCIP